MLVYPRYKIGSTLEIWNNIFKKIISISLMMQPIYVTQRHSKIYNASRHRQRHPVLGRPFRRSIVRHVLWVLMKTRLPHVDINRCHIQFNWAHYLPCRGRVVLNPSNYHPWWFEILGGAYKLPWITPCHHILQANHNMSSDDESFLTSDASI